MKTQTRQFRRCCYLGAASLLLTAAACIHWLGETPANLIQVSAATLSVPQTRSANHILQQSQPICQAMARPDESLQLETTLVRGLPALSTVWHIECTDPNGRSVANLCWNAATGELVSISGYEPLQAGPGHNTLISEQAALRDCRHWLRIAELSAPGSQWRFERPSHVGGPKIWTVEASSYGAHATFQLNGYTGSLYLLRCVAPQSR